MKSYEELIVELSKFDAKIVGQDLPPHSTNLMRQLNKKDARNLCLFNEVCTRYFEFRNEVSNHKTANVEEFVNRVVDKTNNYMNFFSTTNPFSHQQDFTSSIIPEMFYFIFSRIVESSEIPIIVQAQNNLPIECMFDLCDGGRMLFKNKRLDLSLCKKSKLALDGVSHDFVIPMLAMEIKTNLDKNMLAGIENSVSALKRTFPNCMYFVVSEFADLATDKLNYASTDIDEIYIIRNQKRASVRENKISQNSINKALVMELALKAVFLLKSVSDDKLTLEQRMKLGKLI